MVPGSTSGLVGCSFSPASLLWFGNQNTKTLYSFDPVTMNFATLPIPAPNAGLAGVVWHSDGLLYVMIPQSNVIRRLRSDTLGRAQ